MFMALGIWKPSQKHQRGLDMASHTSSHIHSNEALLRLHMDKK